MRIIAILIGLITIVSCQSESTENTPGKKPLDVPATIDADGAVMDSSNLTTVQWIDSLVDFGTVKDGEKVNINFRFKNTGDKPLIVQSVVPGCGCTVPEYTKEPVMPGAEGFIKAVFNSVGQPPTVHKSINVAMNTKGQPNYTLSFIGEVKK
jgi:hypothetical protein